MPKISFMSLIYCLVLISSSASVADLNQERQNQCDVPSVLRCQKEETRVAKAFSSFLLPTIFALLPQSAAMAFTHWTVNNQQLGVDVYRGIRCFELGYRGLQRYYDYAFNQPKTTSDYAVADSQNLSLNQDMFGYLLADTILQTATSGMRQDLLVHHVMGLTLWGSALGYGIQPDIIAINTSVEILSALKGIEYTANQFFGGRENLNNQRILKVAYAFRLAVILGIRYPIWILLDWPIPDRHYDEVGPLMWGVYRTLNIGILGLETLWLYQTARAFYRLRFF